MKVLHVPTNTGGNPQGLAQAERAIGINSHAVTLLLTRYNMTVDEVLWPDGVSLFNRLARQIALIHRAVRNYDIIHYNAGRTIAALPLPIDQSSLPATVQFKYKAYSRYATLLQRYELMTLRRWKRPYFITYQGTDARQADYCLDNFAVTFYREPEGPSMNAADAHIRSQIALLTAGASKVYSLNPDLLHVLPAGTEFLPYASVDPRNWQPTWYDSSRPLIVHAPSQRWMKGTRYVISAVERLRADGMDFDFELIENMPHAEARRRYERAHLLIDQVLGGWYGGLAVELMALGKPVLCHIREEDLKYIPAAMRDDLPIIRAEPDTIYQVLRDWLLRPMEEWRQRGMAGRRYVEAWHDPIAIARRLEKDYRATLDGSRKS